MRSGPWGVDSSSLFIRFWTDFIQAILVVGTAIALPVVAIQEMGGITAFLEQARAVDPSLLTLRGGHNGWDFVINILYWFTFALAVLGQPHSLMRFQSIANEEDLGKALGVAGGFQAIRMTLPLIIGIAGRVLYEGAAVEGTEQVGMMMIMDLFPALLAGLLLAGLISAIISTSDSMILVSATDVTRMVQEVFPDRTISKGTLVTVGRAFIILFSGLGILLALWEPGTIFDIILFAFAGLGATFGLPLLFVLFWDGTTGPGVFAGMIAGLVFSFLHQFHLYPDLFPIFLWPVTGVILIVVSLLTPDRAGEA